MTRVILGVDEVGRGCWAGPLAAGAVILAKPIPGLRDSKKLSARQRQSLSVTILQEAAATGLGWVTPAEVDQLGLTRAVGLAMQRAVESITAPYDQLIVDGNINYFPDNPKSMALIKADDLEPAASAASIIAKVARDAFMAAAAKDHPNYGFEAHLGYGTKAHIEALQKLGPTVLHRMSYKPLRQYA